MEMPLLSVQMEGYTALHMAAKRGDVKLVQYLLGRRARCDLLDEVGSYQWLGYGVADVDAYFVDWIMVRRSFSQLMIWQSELVMTISCICLSYAMRHPDSTARV